MPLSKLSRTARVSVFEGAATTVHPFPVPFQSRIQSVSRPATGG